MTNKVNLENNPLTMSQKKFDPLNQQNYDVKGEKKDKFISGNPSKSHFYKYLKPNNSTSANLNLSGKQETSFHSKKSNRSIKSVKSSKQTLQVPGGEKTVVKKSSTKSIKNGNEVITTKTITTTTTSTIVNQDPSQKDGNQNQNGNQNDNENSKKNTNLKKIKLEGNENENMINIKTVETLEKPLNDPQYGETKKTITRKVFTETLTPTKMNPENIIVKESSGTSLTKALNMGSNDSTSSLRIQTEKLLISPPNKGVVNDNVKKTTTKTITTEVLSLPKNVGDNGNSGGQASEVKPLSFKINSEQKSENENKKENLLTIPNNMGDVTNTVQTRRIVESTFMGDVPKEGRSLNGIVFECYIRFEKY
jgi:hypothetical protein